MREWTRPSQVRGSQREVKQERDFSFSFLLTSTSLKSSCDGAGGGTGAGREGGQGGRVYEAPTDHVAHSFEVRSWEEERILFFPSKIFFSTLSTS